VNATFQIIRKERPTFYFIGVTTTRSSIMRVFPRWMEVLGKPEIAIEGVDLPIHADAQVYRQATAQIKYDPLSLGALVTTHKIDLYQAAPDLFDYLDPYARLCGELSSISKLEGRLEGHAKDPISAGLSMDAILGEGYFGRTGGQVLVFGAGGSATAMLLHLLNKKELADRPKQVFLVDIREERLAHAQRLAESLGSELQVNYVLNGEATRNDALMVELPPGSVVINATGMGKDIPGSPVTDQALFPEGGMVWEFNYRGELDFLHQARRQEQKRGLSISDGWLYFLHGWTQVIAQVLHIELDAALFERLRAAAEEIRS
jgi:shikimate dehydrogenase